MLRLSLVGGLLVIGSSAWAGPMPLTGDALRRELVGSLLEIDTPLVGVVIPVRVSGDGLVSGEAGPLASTLGAAHDRGLSGAVFVCDAVPSSRAGSGVHARIQPELV